MADNVTADVGTGGATFAADDIGGVHYPRTKLTLGADGFADLDLDSGQQTMANSLPVVIASNQSAVAVDASGTTVPVSHTALTELAAAINASSQMDVNIAASNATVAVSNAGLTALNGAISGTEVQVDIVSSALPTGAAAVAAQQFDLIGGASIHRPVLTLITAGPTYTVVRGVPAFILTFDDGTLGWIDGGFVTTSSAFADAIGNGNILGNIIQLPYDCQIDGIAVGIQPEGTTVFDVGLWSDPEGTPTLVESVSVDPQNTRSTGGSDAMLFVRFAQLRTLAKDTKYLIGVKQNSATNISLKYYDVRDALHLQANGCDANVYAVESVAGAAVSTLNSGKRRFLAHACVARIHDTSGGTRIIGG